MKWRSRTGQQLVESWSSIGQVQIKYRHTPSLMASEGLTTRPSNRILRLVICWREASLKKACLINLLEY